MNVIRTWWRFPITEADHSVGERDNLLGSRSLHSSSSPRTICPREWPTPQRNWKWRYTQNTKAYKLQDCKTSKNAEMVFEKIIWFFLSVFLSLTSPALSEWWCRPGECCRGTWSWQCSGKARRSRKWGRWRKRGWTPQLGPPPCGPVSQCDESSETCHNLKKPTMSATSLP